MDNYQADTTWSHLISEEDSVKKSREVFFIYKKNVRLLPNTCELFKTVLTKAQLGIIQQTWSIKPNGISLLTNESS